MLATWRHLPLKLQGRQTRSYARLRPHLVVRAPSSFSVKDEALVTGKQDNGISQPLQLGSKQGRSSQRQGTLDVSQNHALQNKSPIHDTLQPSDQEPAVQTLPRGEGNPEAHKKITSIPADIFYDHWDLKPPTAADLSESRAFFLKNDSKLEYSAEKLVQIPFTSVPEVAFLGRSNVGKSSLINSLFQKEVAKVSHKPGKTKRMNAYSVGNGKMTVLDMPGYGAASQAEWGRQIMKYLQQRKELRRVFLLLDCIEPEGRVRIKQDDQVMLDELSQLRIPYQIIITKADRALFPTQLKQPLTEAKFAVGRGHLRRVLTLVRTQVQELTVGTGQGAANARTQPFGQLLAVTAVNPRWRYLGNEKDGALGIDAVRWAILVASGYAKALPSQVVKEKKLRSTLAAQNNNKS